MSKRIAISCLLLTPTNEQFFLKSWQFNLRVLNAGLCSHQSTNSFSPSPDWKFDMDVGLLLAFFLLLFLLQPLSAREDSQSPSTCPESFSCGYLGLLNFPYTNLSRADCGLCMVKCEAEVSPKIALTATAGYWFDFISVHNSVVNLHDPILQSRLENKSCETFSIDLIPSVSPSISYKILQSITLFKCIINPERSHMTTDAFSGYKNYNSCNQQHGFTIYYQNPPYHAPSMSLNRTIQSNCTALNFPVVLRDNYSENIELFQLLTAEFDLEWHVSDDCYECHREGHMCKTDSLSKLRCANAEKGTKKDTVIIVGTAAPIAGFVILVILAYCFSRKFSFLEICSRTEKFENVEAFLKNYGSLAPKRYYYSEVKKMTNSFKIKLGQGGYGSVYKGRLHNGSLIAVKVLKESKGSGEEFINEVASISRTSHVNIVTLLGFCFQGRKRALVYEFMPNGSLDNFIYGGISSTGRQLGLQILYKIAVGIARGLEYLHRGCNTRMVHLDIKPHNILLDRDFCPKISDFGLAKLCPGRESIVSIVGARGTFGYVAPEVVCKSFGGVSHKSDVYSYGMMIFEMVGGRKNIEVGVDHSSEIYFPDWIYRRIDKSDNLGLDGIMNEEENELAKKMVIVSLWCIQTDPSSRPSISKVLEMLEGSLQALQIPPKPVLSYPSTASEDSSTVNIT